MNAGCVVSVAVVVLVGPLRGFTREGVGAVVHRPVAVRVGIAVSVRVRAARTVNGGGASGRVTVVIVVLITVKIGILCEVGEAVVAGHGQRVELRAGGDVGAEHVHFPCALGGAGKRHASQVVEVVADVGPRAGRALECQVNVVDEVG